MTRYVARLPGKRIRPALALLAAGIAKTKKQTRRGQTPQAGQGSDPSVRLAAAAEMIHTATLLHDDVIDGASLRRGLSTLNAKWGDTLSVLSGDYLYSKAFCLLSGLEDQQVLNLMSNTARTVCEGEVAQIQHQYDLSLSIARYLEIIQWKTASLMSACTQCGALLGGASESEAQGLKAFGLNFGLAFQIMDDTQDLVGEEEAAGKSLGTDLGTGQLTLPLLYLRDASGPQAREALSRWFDGNGSLDADANREILSFLKEEAFRHQVPDTCRTIAQDYLKTGRLALSVFPDSPFKESLFSLTDYLLS